MVLLGLIWISEISIFGRGFHTLCDENPIETETIAEGRSYG